MYKYVMSIWSKEDKKSYPNINYEYYKQKKER